MKPPKIVAYASLLAVAGTTANTQNAEATSFSDETLKSDLKQAICFQDWHKAAELSSQLIASPGITPDHREELIDWRYRFSDYAMEGRKFDTIPNCESVQRLAIEIKVQSSQESTPRFSGNTYAYASDYYCYQVTRTGYVQNLEHMCTGQAGGVATPAVATPPPSPVVLANGDLECQLVGGAMSRTPMGAGEKITIPALCRALRDTQNASVTAQLVAGNRLLDTDLKPIGAMVRGQEYFFDAEFLTDYAASEAVALTVKFL